MVQVSAGPVCLPRALTVPERSSIASLPPLLRVAHGGGSLHVAERPVGRVQVIRGKQQILERGPLLGKLAEAFGQAGQAADLAYFISLPENSNKVPCLLLLPAEPGEQALGGFAGAVLLFQYRTPLGRTPFYSTADTTGRRTVFAPLKSRARMAGRAARVLLGCGAQMVHIVFHEPAEDPLLAGQIGEALGASGTGDGTGAGGAAWALRQRGVPLYLLLDRTFDGTLARIGQRTRSNLRYYRRRTERDLGCGFVPAVRLSLEQFLAFNQACMYAVPEAIARFRYTSLRMLDEAVFCGIQARDGRWLSLVGGRRRHGEGGRLELEIDWQMNREGLAMYSLSTAMRACLIEHEIGLGTERLYIEGGTPHPIGRSFCEEAAAELTVRRESAWTWLVMRLSRRFTFRVYLAQVLRDRELPWFRC